MAHDIDIAMLKHIYDPSPDKVTDLLLGHNISPRTFIMFYQQRLSEYIRVTPSIYRHEDTFLSLVDLLSNDSDFYASIADYLYHPDDISPIPVLRTNQSFGSIVEVGKNFGYTPAMMGGMARELVFILDTSFPGSDLHSNYMDVLLNPGWLRHLVRNVSGGIHSDDALGNIVSLSQLSSSFNKDILIYIDVAKKAPFAGSYPREAPLATNKRRLSFSSRTESSPNRRRL